MRARAILNRTSGRISSTKLSVSSIQKCSCEFSCVASPAQHGQACVAVASACAESTWPLDLRSENGTESSHCAPQRRQASRHIAIQTANPAQGRTSNSARHRILRASRPSATRASPPHPLARSSPTQRGYVRAPASFSTTDSKISVLKTDPSRRCAVTCRACAHAGGGAAEGANHHRPTRAALRAGTGEGAKGAHWDTGRASVRGCMCTHAYDRHVRCAREPTAPIVVPWPACPGVSSALCGLASTRSCGRWAHLSAQTRQRSAGGPP